MNVQAVVDLALAQTFSSTGQLTQQPIVYCNMAYHDVENAIVNNVGDDYFYNVTTDDLTAGTNTYTLATSSATVAGFKKVLSVEAKRATTDTYYTKLKNARDTEYSTSLDDLGGNLPKERGIYDIKGANLVLYPTPTNSVTDGLKIVTIQNLIDLTLVGAETDIFPSHTELRQWHHVIALGMK